MSRRSVLRACAPLVLAAVLAAVLSVVLPDVRIYVTAAPALIVGVLGAAVTLGLLLVGRARARARRDLDRALTAARIEADQSRRRFVTRLDHELKNPLTALLTALSGPGSIDAPARAVATAQAHRIRRLLVDLRRVADVETAQLEWRPVDLPAVLAEAVESAVADDGRSRHVRLDVPTAPWPLPIMLGDADLILVAVYNVIANALKYSGAADVVEVRAREAAGPRPGVVVEVADTGPGIADQEQHVIWEELARGAAGATAPGSGVGLALVRVIVERHGGQVAVRSRLGHGTSILLQWPGAHG